MVLLFCLPSIGTVRIIRRLARVDPAPVLPTPEPSPLHPSNSPFFTQVGFCHLHAAASVTRPHHRRKTHFAGPKSSSIACRPPQTFEVTASPSASSPENPLPNPKPLKPPVLRPLEPWRSSACRCECNNNISGG
jgi:hypothetical protein